MKKYKMRKKITAFLVCIAMLLQMSTGYAYEWTDSNNGLAPDGTRPVSVAGHDSSEYDAVYSYTIPEREDENYAQDYQHHPVVQVEPDTKYRISVGIELLSGSSNTGRNGIYYFLQTNQSHKNLLKNGTYYQGDYVAYNETDAAKNYNYSSYEFFSNNAPIGDVNDTVTPIYQRGGVLVNIHNRDWNAGTRTVAGVKIEPIAYKIATVGDNVSVTSNLDENGTERYLEKNGILTFAVDEGCRPVVTVAGESVSPASVENKDNFYTIEVTGPVVLTVEGTALPKEGVYLDSEKTAGFDAAVTTAQEAPDRAHSIVVYTDSALQNRVNLKNSENYTVANGSEKATLEMTTDNITFLLATGSVAPTLNLGKSSLDATEEATALYIKGRKSIIETNNGIANLLHGIVLTGATATRGAAVDCRNGILNIYGGIISGNRATGEYGGGAISILGSATVTMTDGVITGNISDAEAGGGVALYENGKFYFTGGEIKDNSGYDVYVNNDNFYMSGSAYAGNVYLSNANGIQVNNKFTTAGSHAVIDFASPKNGAKAAVYAGAITPSTDDFTLAQSLVDEGYELKVYGQTLRIEKAGKIEEDPYNSSLEAYAYSIAWEDIQGENLSSTNVTKPLNLNPELRDGVSVTWKAEPEGILDTKTGAITLPQTGFREVVLTAIFADEEETVERTYFFTVQGAEEAEEALTISNVVVTDSEQGTTVAAMLSNDTLSYVEANVYLGLFDKNGQLKKAKKEIVALQSAGETEIRFDMVTDSTDMFRLFVWDDNLAPLCNALSISIDSNSEEGDVLYVAAEADGRGTGSLTSPYTLKQATDAAKILLADDPEKQITISIMGGTYYLDEPISWMQEETPSGEGCVTYKAYRNEKVTLSGAMPLGHLNWKQYDGHIMQTQLEPGYDFDALYAGDSKQILARYPNYEAAAENDPDAPFGYLGDATDVLDEYRISATWGAGNTPPNGWIRALHGAKWGGNDFKITNVTDNGKVEYSWIGDNNRGSSMLSSQMMVENVFEELDAPNEWYYNTDTGVLYYYPESTGQLNASFYAARSEALVRVTGSQAPESSSQTDGSSITTARNITFDGLRFAQTHRTMFTREWERPLRGDWGIQRAGAVFIENAENIKITNCTFNELGGNAVMISGYGNGHVISGNEMTQIGASGVLLVGKTDAVRDPSFWDSNNHKTTVSDTVTGPKTEDYPRDILIQSNYIYDIGMYDKQVAGICTSISSRITMDGNTIHRTPRSCINISDGTFGGHIIENNDMFDCMRGTGDHGQFNSWGRDRYWSYLGYDTSGTKGEEKYPYAKLDAYQTVTIRHNRLYSVDGRGFGIDLDDGSTNYEIYNNLILGVGIKLREGFDRKVYNNIIVGGNLQQHCTFKNSHDEIHHNLIINRKPYGYASIRTTVDDESESTMWNNIAYYGETVPSFELKANITDRDQLVANPKFKDTSKHDYTVMNQEILNHGFVNFSMDGFGVAGKPVPDVYEVDFDMTNTDDTQDYLGGKISSVDAAKQSAAGTPDLDGVYVVETLAELEGKYLTTQTLPQDSVIRTINGVVVKDKQAFINAYEALEAGTTVTVTFMTQNLGANAEFTAKWRK